MGFPFKEWFLSNDIVITNQIICNNLVVSINIQNNIYIYIYIYIYISILYIYILRQHNEHTITNYVDILGKKLYLHV